MLWRHWQICNGTLWMNEKYHSWPLGMILPKLFCHSWTMFQWDYQYQSHPANFISHLVPSCPVPFVCSQIAISPCLLLNWNLLSVILLSIMVPLVNLAWHFFSLTKKELLGMISPVLICCSWIVFQRDNKTNLIPLISFLIWFCPIHLLSNCNLPQACF